MSGDLEPPGFGGDQGVFVGLGGGQGAGRIQLHQIIIIIEHAFNIRRITDTFPTKRHPGDRRTTPNQSGQHLWTLAAHRRVDGSRSPAT